MTLDIGSNLWDAGRARTASAALTWQAPSHFQDCGSLLGLYEIKPYRSLCARNAYGVGG